MYAIVRGFVNEFGVVVDNKILAYPVDSPLKMIALVLVFVVGCAIGLPRIIVEGNLEAMLDEQEPLLVQLHAVEREFTENHSILIGVIAQTTVFKPETIGLVQAITEQAWQTPHAYRVDSLSNFQYTQVDGDDLLVGDLFPTDVEMNALQFERAKQIALTQPETLNQLVSADEKMAAMHISFNLSDTENYDSSVAEILAYVKKMLALHRTQNPELEIIISGKLALDNGIQHYVAKDGATLIPLMLLLMIVILFFLLRSITATLGTILVVSLTGLATMGLVGWMGVALDAITSLSPIVIMTLAVADAVHINTGVISGLSKGMSKRDALYYSIEHNALPVFLTSLTTVLGVITFIFTKMPTVQHLGLIIAIGVAIAFALSMTLLPAVLSLLPMQKKSSVPLTSLAWLAEFVIAQHKKLLLFVGLFSIILAAMAPSNELNESPELFFKPWTIEKQSMVQVNEHMAGVSTIDFALYTHKPGAIATPEFLAILEEFGIWMRSQPGVGHVKTVGDTFKQLNKNMHADDHSWYRQPESQALAAQYLLLYELSLPFGLDLTNQINLDKSGVRLTVTTKNLHAANRLALQYQAQSWFAEHAPQVEAIATGHSPVLEKMTIEQLMPDMLRGGMIAIAMVSLVLFVVLRSWKLGFLGLLANIMPVMMGYGVWSQINGIANIAVMSVAGICLGVVVDFAVHFLTKYRYARLRHNSPADSVRYAFEKIGFPLWTTTLVLVSGFWLLTLSAITLNSALGALTGIIILITLLFDFLLLPSMLLILDRSDKP